MNWFILIVIVILVLMFFRKYIEHKIVVFLLLLLFVFIFLSMLTIFKTVKTQNIDYKSPEGIVKTGRLYFNWVWSVIGNIKTLTGSAIKMDWASNISESNITKK